MKGTDWVGIIGAVLTPFSVIILAYFSMVTSRQVKATHAKVVQVDEAVNGKLPGITSISEDVAIIKDKQELDNPSTLVATKANGDASLRLQVAHLVKLVEKLEAAK